jgi:hypothetical protein
MGKLEKILAPKFDSLCKQYSSRKKTTFPMPNVFRGTLYYVKNEVLYISRNGESVLDRVMQGVEHEGLKKIIIDLSQFSTYFEKESPCLNMKT